MTEIATTTDQYDIEILPPARPAASEALGQLMAHAQAMTAAKQLGDALAATDMVPVDYKGKPGNAAAAILYGAELGLNPIQSLQQIFVIHGKPAIYARTAVALVKRSGIHIETVTSTDDAVTVRATDPRTGQVEESTWDKARAEQAKYNNEKYKTDPQAMLYAKAAMEVCRKIAPDVLLGIPYAREELDLEQPVRVQSQREPQRARGVAALAERVAQPADSGRGGGNEQGDGAESSSGTSPESPPADQSGLSEAARKKWENRMFALLAEGDCTGRDDQLIVITALAGRSDADTPEHRNQITDDELKNVVNAMNAAAKDKTLGAVITDILNSYVARQADEGGAQ